jgi:ABC-type sugar transport system ATPase subunit
MDKGRLLQTGPTPDVYRQPATTRVAEIFSDPPINFIDGKANENHAIIGRAIRYDSFKRPDFREQFRKIYGYELGVPVNWSANEDIADFLPSMSAK